MTSAQPQATAPWDYVIVGAGPAGCVLANRLSESGAHRVLLLEAGMDLPPGREPWQVRDTFGPSAATDARFMWPGVQVRWAPHAARQPRRYEQARVMGGGSSVNGMWAIRGFPEDYDDWRDAGATGWGWDEMLPCFRRIEADHDFGGPLHGRDGPMPVRRHWPAEWPALCRSLCEAAGKAGWNYVEDMNAQYEDGYCSVPMNSDGRQRISASMAYLGPQVRARPNLSIRCGVLAERVLFSGHKACGVAVRDAQGRSELAAREVIVSAGAFQSPALLMRSGIGAADMLASLGLPVVSHAPGVGRNLHDHPYMYLGAHLRRAAMQPANQRPWVHSCLRFSSQVAGCAPSDMILTMLNKTMWHPLGRRIGAVGISVYKSHSRGSVTLRSTDAAAFPDVDFNLLEDPRDMARMLGGLRLAYRLLHDASVLPMRTEVFAASYSDAVRRINTRTALNWVKAGAFALLLDGPAPMRRALLSRFVTQGEDIHRIIDDDDAARDFIRRHCAGVYHPVGTCRIGAPSDPLSVLDSHCRVRGVDSLRVVDASVMPVVPRANTHFPVLALAQRAADLLLDRGAGH